MVIRLHHPNIFRKYFFIKKSGAVLFKWVKSFEKRNKKSLNISKGFCIKNLKHFPFRSRIKSGG